MDRVEIVEVGPRDGLQAEPSVLPTASKVDLIERLTEAGLRRIEATSFVSPAAVPQLADADELMALLPRRPDVEVSALVPNERGLDRALAARIDRVAVFTSASESFARSNLRCSIDGSFERLGPVVDRATAAGIPIRGYVSMAWWCPFEGRIEPAATLAVAHRLDRLGCDEIALADTVGRATPREVRALIDLVTTEIPVDRIALHLHDTGGQAVANVEAAVERGVRTFDASVGGLGGCPFAPGSPGNLATEVLVDALDGLGLRTGVDPAALRRAFEVTVASMGSAA